MMILAYDFADHGHVYMGRGGIRKNWAPSPSDKTISLGPALYRSCICFRKALVFPPPTHPQTWRITTSTAFDGYSISDLVAGGGSRAGLGNSSQVWGIFTIALLPDYVCCCTFWYFLESFTAMFDLYTSNLVCSIRI